jgi:hypothetical protein
VKPVSAGAQFCYRYCARACTQGILARPDLQQVISFDGEKIGQESDPSADSSGSRRERGR